MELKRVFSSSVDSLGYDSSTRELHVKFQTGKTAVYNDVPPDVAQRVVDAPSVGSALYSYIKGHYSYGYLPD